MKQLYAVIIILIYLTTDTNAQTDKYFIKNHQWVNVHNSLAIVQENNEYLMLTEALDYSTGIWGTYFVKLNTNLDINTVNPVNFPLEHTIRSLTKVNGGYIGGGFSQIDPWSTAFGFVAHFNNTTSDITAFNVNEVTLNTQFMNSIQLSNGNILLVGMRSESTFETLHRMYIVTLDANLNEINDTVYINPPYNDLRCYINKIIPTQDGNYMLLATINDLYGQPPGDVMLLKINETGDILWQQVYDYGDNEETYDIIATQDGGFLFTTTAKYSDIQDAVSRIVKITPNYMVSSENIAWIQDSLFRKGIARCAIQLIDGTYIIAGNMITEFEEYINPNNGLYEYNASLVKLDENGVLLWQRYYHTLDDDYIYDMILEQSDPTGKSGFVLCGRNDSTDADYAYLLKLNCMGLLTEPQASFNYSAEANIAYLHNTSQYVYPDSTDGGYFVWDFGDNTPPYTQTATSETPIAHAYQNAGTYTVTLTAIVCNDTSTYTQAVEVYPVGLMENERATVANAYPNPAKDKLYIPYNIADNQTATISIYNVQGKLINTANLQYSGTYTLHTETLLSGIYFYEIRTTNNEVLIKEKVSVVK